MIEFMFQNSGLIVSVLFFTMFVGIAIWAYLPGNKGRMLEDANIPFKEDNHV